MSPATQNVFKCYYPVAIVGGGQAGLSLSYFLSRLGIEHVVLEKETLAHAWRTRRWDAFSLVTPNWQCALPGHPYQGPDPHGFMTRDEIVQYLDEFIAKLDAPAVEGVTVTRIKRGVHGEYDVQTSAGDFIAGQVVVASGENQTAIIPYSAEQIPADIVQIHSGQYRNPAQLPAGSVLVAGSGQSGVQIAEDLHLAGKKVYLATGEAPRCTRFYRGRDVMDWLGDMHHFDISIDQHPLKEGARDKTNPYVTGRDGGHDIDLRAFAREGMELYGTLLSATGATIRFAPNLREHLDSADKAYNATNAGIDKHIAANKLPAPPPSVYQPVWQPAAERTELDLREQGIKSVVWCIGFRPEFGWVDAPVFNGRGQPVHTRGVTSQDGLYFLGLSWLDTWGSGRFLGIARDAEYLAARVADRIADGLPIARPQRMDGH